MTTGPRLVSPVATPAGEPVCAPRPTDMAPSQVLLVDAMLNQQAGWGRALLDGAREVLAERWQCDFIRVARPANRAGPSEEWASGIAGSIDCAVIAVGD